MWLFITRAKYRHFEWQSSTFLFDSYGSGGNITPKPRDDIFPKRTKIYILSFKPAVCAGSAVKTRLDLHGGFSPQEPKNAILGDKIFTFWFDSLRWGGNTRPISCDGIFPKRPKMYILSLKPDVFAVFVVKIRPHLHGGFTTKTKNTILSENVPLSYSIPMYQEGTLGESTWWHFPKKTYGVHFNFQTGRFCWIWSENTSWST